MIDKMKRLLHSINTSLESLVPRFMQRRHRRITFEGVMFVVLTMVIGLAALNTGANLLYLILSMMLCLLILSGIISSLTLMGLKLVRIAPRQAIARQPQNARLDITNTKPLIASFSLRFDDVGKNGERYGGGYIFHIRGKQTHTTTYEIMFPRRGLYTLNTMRIGSRFPFGFFHRSIDFQDAHDVIVYPQILRVDSLVRGRSIESGDVETSRKGIGTSLYGLREYTPEDSARLIHWKVSARAQKIMVRELEKEEKKRISITLNNYIPESDTITRDTELFFERAIVFCASLARYFIEHEYNVQVLTASGKIPYGNGTGHMHRILRALALLELRAQPPDVPLTLPRAEAETAVIFLRYRDDPKPRVARSTVEIIDVRTLDISEFKHISRVQSKRTRQNV